jgi:hypothetical protein
MAVPNLITGVVCEHFTLPEPGLPWFQCPYDGITVGERVRGPNDEFAWIDSIGLDIDTQLEQLRWYVLKLRQQVRNHIQNHP